MTGRQAAPMRADARRNRESILAAADEAFAAEGVGVPVDEIARRAGVGPGTLYRHFPTKEALFEAVVVSHMERLADYAASLAEREDPGPALRDFMTCLAGEAAAKKNLIDALVGAGFDFEAGAARPKRAVEAGFGLLLARAQAAGAVRPDVTTADLFGLVMGACALGGQGGTGASSTRMLDIVLSGIRSTGD